MAPRKRRPNGYRNYNNSDANNSNTNNSNANNSNTNNSNTNNLNTNNLNTNKRNTNKTNNTNNTNNANNANDTNNTNNRNKRNNSNNTNNTNNMDRNNGHNRNGNDNSDKSKNTRRKNGRNDHIDVSLEHEDILALQKAVVEFIASGKREIELPDLDNIHRKFVHGFAAKMGIKTRSYGPKNARVLCLMHQRLIFNITTPLHLSTDVRQVADDIKTFIHQNSMRNNRNLANNNIPRLQNRNRYRIPLSSRMVPPFANYIDDQKYRDAMALPINNYKAQIFDMLEKHQVFILNGETGSGKTTQVPQYILEDSAANNLPCRIIVTQPRRIAAVSVANRVATERNEPMGKTVGYQIRMESFTSKDSNLIYTTSGSLLRCLMGDPNAYFRNITHLLIDEIHERDKYTDFILITVKKHLRFHKNLRIILMSATMDIKLLSEYFYNCPVLFVPGQNYTVNIMHLEDFLIDPEYRPDALNKYIEQSEKYKEIIEKVEPDVNDDESENAEPVLLDDAFLQNAIDALFAHCFDINYCHGMGDDIDQIRYYFESESVPVNVVHSENGVTALMIASKNNLPEFVEYLIQKKASIHIMDKNDKTALNYASQHKDGKCYKILQNVDKVFDRINKNKDEEKKIEILNIYGFEFCNFIDIDHDLIAAIIRKIHRDDKPGSIMVFLPGYSDIIEQRDLIENLLPPNTYTLCILHGQMESDSQMDVLQKSKNRKIILSTNIGQTSLTVADLTYIIDTGKVKLKSYDSVTESSKLQAVWISKADASQRSGRAGRTHNGYCYRLYSSSIFNTMSDFCVPEFMRIPLTEICLYARTLDSTIPVETYLSLSLNPPSIGNIRNAVTKLQTLKIFDDNENVTELGHHLVELPVDVQLGKTLIYSVFLRCVEPILTIVAFHSVKDPFILPSNRAVQSIAMRKRKAFAKDFSSDQVGIINLYKAYTNLRARHANAYEFCAENFISYSAMEMFCATRSQIAELLALQFNLSFANTHNNDFNMIRLCLATGFYPNIAYLNRTKVTLSTGIEKQLVLQKSSALNPESKRLLHDFIKDIPHDWILYFEKSRTYQISMINMCTTIKPFYLALQCNSFDNIPIEELTSFATERNGDDNAEQNKDMLLIINNWISFRMDMNDAKFIQLLSADLEERFNVFLKTNIKKYDQNCVTNLLRRLLKAVES